MHSGYEDELGGQEKGQRTCFCAETKMRSFCCVCERRNDQSKSSFPSAGHVMQNCCNVEGVAEADS